MAEKNSGKKEQQKNKKKQNEKKKNQENGIKHVNEQPANNKQNNANIPQKKKDKSNKNSSKASKKKSVSNSRSFFSKFFFKLFVRSAIIFLCLGYIYIVDYETFTAFRNKAEIYFNKIISLLPNEVITKGKQAVDFVRPTTEVIISKASIMVNETSNFFNTNSLVKDHWANIKEIGSICGARLVDYMRTLHLQVTGYCLDFKNKIFQ